MYEASTTTELVLSTISNFSLLLALLFLTITKNNLNLIQKNKISTFILILAFIIAPFRTTGLDYYSYKKIYDYDIKGFFISDYNIEPLFNFLSYSFIKAGISFSFFILSINAITLTVYLICLKKLKTKEAYIINFLFFLFCYFSYIDVTRAFFSSVMIFAFLVFYKTLLHRFFLLSAAILMHYSSLSVLPYIIFRRLKIPYKPALLIVFLISIIVNIAFSTENLRSDNYILHRIYYYSNTIGFGLRKEELASTSHLILLSITIYYIPIVLFILYLLLPISKDRGISIFKKTYQYANILFLFFMTSGYGLIAVRLYLLFIIPIIYYIYSIYITEKNSLIINYLLITSVFYIISITLYTGQFYLPSSKFYLGF